MADDQETPAETAAEAVERTAEVATEAIEASEQSTEAAIEAAEERAEAAEETAERIADAAIEGQRMNEFHAQMERMNQWQEEQNQRLTTLESSQAEQRETISRTETVLAEMRGMLTSLTPPQSTPAVTVTEEISPAGETAVQVETVDPIAAGQSAAEAALPEVVRAPKKVRWT